MQIHYSSFNEQAKSVIESETSKLREKLLHSFQKLNSPYGLSRELFSRVIKRVSMSNESDVNGTGDNSGVQTEEGDRSNMSMTIRDYLRLCAQTIPKNYSGDPLGLTAFIRAIRMLRDLTEENQEDSLLNFIMTRLEGKAQDAVPAEPESIQEIIDSLKEKIKHDSSKVISGRITAMKNQKIQMNDFSKQMEELTDSLKRALMFEGMTQDKANEMAVDKAVEICRASARSVETKAILGGGNFKDAKEVLSKFAIESSEEKEKEKQVFSFKAGGNFRGNFNRGRGFGNSYRGQNQRAGFQGYYRGGYNNNYYQGNRGYYNQSGRGNFRGRYNNARGGRPTQNVRYAENSEPPSEERRGNQSNNQGNNQANNRQGDRS